MDDVDVSQPFSDTYIDNQINKSMLVHKQKNDEIDSIVDTWIHTIIDYTEKHNKIVDEMCETYNNLLDLMEYASNIKIPFCWEYVRCSFMNELHELMNEFQVNDMELSTFIDVMNAYKHMSIHKGDIKVSDSSIDFVGNLLSYYAHKSSCMKEDLTNLKKQGYDAFLSSQQVSSNCGEYL